MKPIVDHFVAPPCHDHLEILYQDDDILLINKPTGLLSLSGKNPLNLDSVHHRLINGQSGITPSFPKATLPHRLDLGTSGIMVAGLHPEASKHLNKQFQDRKVQKQYHAILYGHLSEDEGLIEAPIAKDSKLFPKVKICPESGKSASTHYKVLDRLEHPHRTRVQFTPITGRTHQLRIHSQRIDHPILGCDLYQNESSESMSERLLLHASHISFQHPINHQAFQASSPCPF